MGSVVQPEEVDPLVAGLVGGIDVGGGPTNEQLAVLRSLVSQLWKRSDIEMTKVTPLGPRAMWPPRSSAPTPDFASARF